MKSTFKCYFVTFFCIGKYGTYIPVLCLYVWVIGGQQPCNKQHEKFISQLYGATRAFFLIVAFFCQSEVCIKISTLLIWVMYLFLILTANHVSLLTAILDWWLE